MIAIAIYNRRIALAKDRALKSINKIIRLKLSAVTLEELISSICQKLNEDLGKKFAIILKEDLGVKNYGDEWLTKKYSKKIAQVLINPRRLFMMRGGKIVNFCPLEIDNKKIGIFLTEVNFSDDFLLSFRKILPSIVDQISFILDSFQTRALLNEIKINEEREQLRSLILSSISHDLKTPLSSIIGGLTIYNKLNDQDKLSKEDQHDLISTALDEAKRLNQFISDVLEMTKIKSGAIVLQKALFDPLDVIEKILNRFQLKLRGYEVDISLSRKVRIAFDPVSFEQIMQNLLDNSLKYSTRNTKITIYEEFDAEGFYNIFIQDEGNGVDPEKLDLIFNKFERFTTDKVSGAGLGLSIVKALMEANNAKISAQNVEGKSGIIFNLQFRDFQKCITN